MVGGHAQQAVALGNRVEFRQRLGDKTPEQAHTLLPLATLGCVSVRRQQLDLALHHDAAPMENVCDLVDLESDAVVAPGQARVRDDQFPRISLSAS
jgi:hypothetical protein